MEYTLRAKVSTDNPVAVEPVLTQMIRRGTVTRTGDGHDFDVTGVLDGATARDLNRQLLSELRRAEKRTRLRAEWTCQGTAERFFDYVPKGTRKASSEQAGSA